MQGAGEDMNVLNIAVVEKWQRIVGNEKFLGSYGKTRKLMVNFLDG